jgi:3-phosphoshikimate 1-carboxyvinyltransferase
MLAAIADGESRIHNYSSGADCQSTLSCFAALGAPHSFTQEDGERVLVVQGRGLHGLIASSDMLDAGNSGSTIRMLSGILAGQPFSTRIAGDESLNQRPMRRIITPLQTMGARIEATADQFPPLTIHGMKLRGIDYSLPVASAQVKSCVLLAGLYAEGETTVRETVTTRDHTEIALREFGADVYIQPKLTRVIGGTSLKGKTLTVPGDLSSAAFFIVAALIVPGSNVILTNVGLNPTRTALLDVLRGMGADIKILRLEQVNGELIGNLQIRSSELSGGTIAGPTTTAVIDEVPILSVLATRTLNGLSINDAGELRVKETDRIETIAAGLRTMGVEVQTSENALRIPGRQKLRGAEVDSCGDHRIAMAFSVAALIADQPSVIKNAGAASVSFPEFFDTLRRLGR